MHSPGISMGFSRQEYWSGLPFSSPGDLPDPGIRALSPVASVQAGSFFSTALPGKPQNQVMSLIFVLPSQSIVHVTFLLI